MTARPLAAALAAMVVLGHAAPASAQLLSSEMRRIGLVDADWRAMMAAAQTLYDPEIAEPGAQAEWSSDTGAAGLVTLEAVTAGEAGSPCVTLGHAVTPPRADPSSFTVRRCRNEAGAWPVAADR